MQSLTGGGQPINEIDMIELTGSKRFNNMQRMNDLQGVFQLSANLQQQNSTPLSGLRPQFSLASSNESKNQEGEPQIAAVAGTKRPRRMAALKMNKDDSQDPYIYTGNTKVINRRARGAA